MNSEREEIIRQINETPIEDLNKNVPKKSKWESLKGFLKDLVLFRVRFLGAIFGVTEDNIGSSGKSAGHGGHGNGHTCDHSQSSGNTFKDSVSFDPSKAYMERIQEKAYFSMIDGKGDHDCDHEH